MSISNTRQPSFAAAIAALKPAPASTPANSLAPGSSGAGGSEFSRLLARQQDRATVAQRPVDAVVKRPPAPTARQHPVRPSPSTSPQPALRDPEPSASDTRTHIRSSTKAAKRTSADDTDAPDESAATKPPTTPSKPPAGTRAKSADQPHDPSSEDARDAGDVDALDAADGSDREPTNASDPSSTQTPVVPPAPVTPPAATLAAVSAEPTAGPEIGSAAAPATLSGAGAGHPNGIAETPPDDTTNGKADRADAVAPLYGDPSLAIDAPAPVNPLPDATLAAVAALAAGVHKPESERADRPLSVDAAVAPVVAPGGFGISSLSRAVDAAALPSGNVSTALTDPGFHEALGLQVSLLARDGIQQAELRLNPAEMGPVSVHITMHGDQARVDFGADLAQTRQVIEAGWAELAASLREAGFTLSGGGVSEHAGRGAAERQPTASAGGAGRPARADEVPEASTVSARPRAGSAVDLYA